MSVEERDSLCTQFEADRAQLDKLAQEITF